MSRFMNWSKARDTKPGIGPLSLPPENTQAQLPAPIPQPVQKPTTVIAHGTCFEGTLVSVDQVIIEGEFKGQMTAGQLLIREKAIVEGEFKADIMVLHGKITGGPVDAKEIILESTAHIIGNVNYERMVMKDGALVEGQMSKRSLSGAANIIPMTATGSKG